ncbi:MAG TPA: cytochrome c biogenesis protein ResB [Anaerolineae bacterium]|nr:cytochrome c biogenesis protein ResB [Anaerolineae bacterium]
MDILDLFWRALGSRSATVALMIVLILALTCGAILPQGSDVLAADPPQYAQWRAEVQARYRQWADPLSNLGLFSIRESYWLTITLVLLVVNLVLCSVDRFDEARRRRQPVPEYFARALSIPLHVQDFLLEGEQESVMARLRQLLESRRYSVEVQESGSVVYLAAQRFAAGEWMSLLGHSGLVLVVVSLIIGGRLAWREQGIALSPGQEYQAQQDPSLSFRLDHFEAELYASGEAKSYAASVTVLENGSEVARGPVVPGAPLRYRGLSLHQLSHGPLVGVRATDADGAALSMRALAPSGAVIQEANLLLDEETEGYLTVPDRNLLLRIVYQSGATSEAPGSPSLLVQAYHGGTTELILSETLSNTGTLEIYGDSYAIEWGQYGVFGIASDPTAGPLLAGSVALLSGITASVLFRPRFLWAAIRGQEGVTEIQLLDPGQEYQVMGTREFRVLMSELEEALSGS